MIPPPAVSEVLQVAPVGRRRPPAPARVPVIEQVRLRARGAMGTFFRLVLALYVAVSVAKVHDLQPALASLQPAKITAALLLVLALFVLPWREVVRAVQARPARWIWLTALLAVATLPTALWKGYAVAFLTTEYWKLLLVFVISAAAWAERRTLITSLGGVVMGGAAVAGHLVMFGGSWRPGAGPAFDSNESALMFLVLLPLALYLASRKGWWRVLWYACAVLLLVAIVKTGSRGGFVGLMVMGAWQVAHAPPRRRLRQIVLAVAGILVFAASANETTKQRFTSIFEPTEDYNFDAREGRFEVWKRGVKYMYTHPLQGVGIKNFGIAEGMISGKADLGYGIKFSAAHNSFVEIGAELGVLGLIAFTMTLWTAFKGLGPVALASRQARGRPRPVIDLAHDEAVLGSSLRAALVAFAAAGFFLSFAYHPITYFLIALCVGGRLGIPPAFIPPTVSARERRAARALRR